MELSTVAASDDEASDELVLSEPEAASTAYDSTPASSGDAGAHSAPAGEEAPSRSIGGGTLFERMSRLSRGSAAPEADEEKEDGVDIPRFLGRQNNQ